jgi:transcriptional regulator with XRE-family HTH domain
MDDMTFGEIICTLRKRQKMSQGALAKKASVSRNTVSLIERSDTNVTLSTMIAVSRALGYDFAVALKATEARNEAPTE